VSKVLHIQQRIAASPANVFRALTDGVELQKWFAEHADVSLPRKRYDFWGRFTPEAPSRAEGGHQIDLVESDSRLRFRWTLRGGETSVDIRLTSRGAETIVDLQHRDIPAAGTGGMSAYALEDVWFLALENLRRHLAGRDVVWCDFTKAYAGEVRHTVAIEGSPAQVWDALITPAQLERWIASNATVDPRVGGTYDLGWGEWARLEILSLAPERELVLRWEVEGTPTVVTWTLEGSAGRTRVTIVHSGFAPDERVDGLGVGWLHYLLWVKSLVEMGPEWYPAIKELSRDLAVMYAASIWAAQDELLESGDAGGEVV
jgi:uncharacterized protein YndB with AHSA1/START domain